MAPRLVQHSHNPIYRVVRADWADPLDASYSLRTDDNRWNPRDAFMVLYTCCSERVATAIVRDRLRRTATTIDDLADDKLPQLCDLQWNGPAVDVASLAGIRAAGFPDAYPDGVDKQATQERAAEWHRAHHEAVLCRSAAVWRMGWNGWSDPHEPWSELAIFVQRAMLAPVLMRRRHDLEWLLPEALR